MKSIDKLREWSCHTDLHEIADEIESEIANHYMCLPVDADGVPIHVGDICEWNGDQFEVRQLRTDGDYWWAVERLGAFCMAKECHHVKPRTLEDVLIEYRLKAYNLYADQELTGDERVDEFKKLDAEYDSEIRELLGGDA